VLQNIQHGNLLFGGRDTNPGYCMTNAVMQYPPRLH
jgi:hypothetical protein